MRRVVVLWVGLAVVLAGCSLLPGRGGAGSGEAVPVAADLPRVPAVVVLDASGSMKVDDAPGQRFRAAQVAVRSLVEKLSDEHQLGLVTYGTGTGSKDSEAAKGCQDVTTAVPFGTVKKKSFVAAVDGLRPSGYTPIGLALRSASKLLPKGEKSAITLISDGIDTCASEERGPDPCVVAKELKKANPDLVVHTVAFRVADDPAAREQLSCIASATGGLDLDAGNATLLSTRLLAAFDPARAASSVQPSGFRGLRPGMSVDEVKKVATKLPAVKATGRVEIVYVDCTLTFDDGVLVEVAPKSRKVRTLDGVGVGTDVKRAEQLYGDPDVPTKRTKNTVTYTADADAGTGYRITFKPTSGQIAGRITTLVLCRCRGADSSPTLRDVQRVTYDDVPQAVTSNIAGGGSEFVTAVHPTLGRIWIFLGANADVSQLVGFDEDGTRFWTSDDIAAPDIEFADPVSDATGNVFVRYNPGRYDGTIVIRATGTGLEEIQQSRRDETGYQSSFYYTELIGPGSDGRYVIRSMNNDCDPSCAGGTVTTTDLYWDGREYAPR